MQKFLDPDYGQALLDHKRYLREFCALHGDEKWTAEARCCNAIKVIVGLHDNSAPPQFDTKAYNST